MNKTTYHIEKMDCLSEEQIIRMKPENFPGIKSLQFEIPERKLYVMHEGDAAPISKTIESLHLNSSLIKIQIIDEEEAALFLNNTGLERKLLWQVLAIN